MLLEAIQVERHFRGRHGLVRAVDGVSLRLEAGEVVVIRGPSGCGKTTLLLALGGLLCPSAGQVRLEGVDPYALGGDARADLRARKVGLVFQQFHLVPYLTVRENVLAASLPRGSTATIEQVDGLLHSLGLAHRGDAKPGTLSTGERQRTALARAMLNRPPLLLADEPTGNLDDASAAAVLEQLARYAVAGRTVLIMTHDPRAAACASRSLNMAEGRLL